MKDSVALVFPHQLFEIHPALAETGDVYLIEDKLFFSQFRFHKKKLLLHRASMQFYADYTRKKGHNVVYIQHHQAEASLDILLSTLASKQVREVVCCDPADYLLERRLRRFTTQHGITLTLLPSPGFLNTRETLHSYFGKTDHYFMHHFYMQERKRLNILMENKKPVGNKWSFDEDNRKKIPKGLALPKYWTPTPSAYTTEAEQYVNQYFGNNLGTVGNFHFPVTFQDAKHWLSDFLIHRFAQFGPYEDAILSKENYLFHSVLTPSLNTGLLTPGYVIEQVLKTATEQDIPLASIEGFIRQIIGWREFIRGTYHYQGTYERKRNYWNHTRKLSDKFYSGETGIIPVDQVIQRLHQSAYSHHIERLMVIGNFMLLCEIDPDDVYKWFMEFYIDAYDWVMVPNVYGMSQFADGGLMSTKPYLSGSNYILKMSDYKEGDWSKTWNALYWRFIAKHRDFFLGNQRTMMITKSLDRMDKSVIQGHISKAENFLERI